MQDLIPYKSEIWLLCIVVIPDSGSCLLLVLYYSPDISVPSQYNKPHVDKDIALMLITGYWNCSDFNSAIHIILVTGWFFSTLVTFIGIFIWLRWCSHIILASLNWSLYVICQIIILKTSTLICVAHICDWSDQAPALRLSPRCWVGGQSNL